VHALRFCVQTFIIALTSHPPTVSAGITKLSCQLSPMARREALVCVCVCVCVGVRMHLRLFMRAFACGVLCVCARTRACVPGTAGSGTCSGQRSLSFDLRVRSRQRFCCASKSEWRADAKKGVYSPC
jgi:hypothetical protein